MQRFYTGGVESIGDREVGVIAATAQVARDGHVLVPDGIDLSNFKQNPIVLWQHDVASPVATATAIGVENGQLAARMEFAPAGVSETADEVCALVKSGIVRGVSVGFDVIEAEPLDPARGSRGGLRIGKSELLEISFCSVPVDTGAMVVARSVLTPAVRLATFAALPRVAPAAIQRAARSLRPRSGKILSHAGHVYALQQLEREKEREREERYSFENRQARLRELARRWAN